MGIAHKDATLPCSDLLTSRRDRILKELPPDVLEFQNRLRALQGDQVEERMLDSECEKDCDTSDRYILYYFPDNHNAMPDVTIMQTEYTKDTGMEGWAIA